MSHVTTINLAIKDLDAIERAGKRLGLTLNRERKTMRSYQSGLKCDHTLSVTGNPDAYEIGLKKQADDSYALSYDYFLGGYGMTAKVGYGQRDVNKLNDWYAAEVARKTMSKQGWKVTATQEAGKVKVLCRK